MKNKINIQNKRASFDYEWIEKYTAGIVLSGAEVKSLQNGHGRITEAFCSFFGSEFSSDNKEYIFIGGGCGITYLKFDRLSEKGMELDDIEYNVINNIHAYISNSFTDKEKAYYLKIGNPIMAVITQDRQIQVEIYSRIVKFAKEVLGIKNISYVSVLD